MSPVSQPARSTVDHIAKARDAWGAVPDWVLTLAEACVASSQSAVAKRIEYSPATVSQVLSNTYRGDLTRVAEMVRGALMSETVVCPILGDLTLNRCLDWQGKPQVVTSALRANMFKACRAGCPHSRLTPKGESS